MSVRDDVVTSDGTLSQRHDASSCCRWKKMFPDMEDSCEYIE